MSSIGDVHSKIDELFNDVRRYRKSSEFRELIRFVARFKTLSPFNSMLAHMQRPESRFLLRASEWKKKYDRGIKEDARPIVILVPFGPVDFLFEVGDTYPLSPKLDGKDDILDYLAQPYDTVGKLDRNYYYCILENLANNAISYKKFRAAADFAGKISISTPGEQVTINIGTKKKWHLIAYKSRFTISVNETTNTEAEFGTLCHELGHLLCRHIPSPDGWWKQRSLTKEAEEFEAEVVSSIVCGHVGIESKSEKYLNQYLDQNANIPNDVSIDVMWNAVNEIIKMVQGVSVENGIIYKYDKDFKNIVKEYKAEKKQNKKADNKTSDKEKLSELPFSS